jgi:hypothetical protein
MSLPEIFLVGSLWFWLLLIAETILVFILLEWDKGTIATLTFLATLLLLQFLGDVNVYGYVVQHPLTVILGATGYFTLGTLWAIAKWWFYVREQRSGYDELRSAFLRVHRLESQQSAMPEGLQHQWQHCLELAKRKGRRLDVRPLAAAHKRTILRWMSYWPWFFSWTVLTDPVRKAFLTIYHNVAEYLRAISDRAFKGVEADLPLQEDLPIVQRTDPVLMEFGIDLSALGSEQASPQAKTAQQTTSV